jgi:hypothetical protein
MPVSVLLVLFMGPSAWAQIPPPFLIQKRIMGRPASVTLEAEAHSADSGASGTLSSVLLGRKLRVIRMDSTPAPTAPAGAGDPIATTRLELSGIRIWSGQLAFQKGALRYSGAIPAVQIPLPLLAYPLGPVLLRLDTGFELEGRLEASLAPGLSFPIEDSSIEARLAADLAVSGYIEGSGSLYLVRAGVEGRVDLVDGEARVNSLMFLNRSAPRAEYAGQAVLMKGDIEAFVDTHLPVFSWRRILSKRIFSWPGRCFGFGAGRCAGP